MKINTDTIDKIAHLARLEFNEEAKEQIKTDMNNLLDFVDQLNEINTSNIEPLIYISDEVNVLREDIVKHDITQVEALKNSPDHDSDYFKVPTMIEK